MMSNRPPAQCPYHQNTESANEHPGYHDLFEVLGKYRREAKQQAPENFKVKESKQLISKCLAKAVAGIDTSYQYSEPSEATAALSIAAERAWNLVDKIIKSIRLPEIKTDSQGNPIINHDILFEIAKAFLHLSQAQSYSIIRSSNPLEDPLSPKENEILSSIISDNRIEQNEPSVSNATTFVLGQLSPASNEIIAIYESLASQPDSEEYLKSTQFVNDMVRLASSSINIDLAFIFSLNDTEKFNYAEYTRLDSSLRHFQRFIFQKDALKLVKTTNGFKLVISDVARNKLEAFVYSIKQTQLHGHLGAGCPALFTEVSISHKGEEITVSVVKAFVLKLIELLEDNYLPYKDINPVTQTASTGLGKKIGEGKTAAEQAQEIKDLMAQLGIPMPSTQSTPENSTSETDSPAETPPPTQSTPAAQLETDESITEAIPEFPIENDLFSFIKSVRKQVISDHPELRDMGALIRQVAEDLANAIKSETPDENNLASQNRSAKEALIVKKYWKLIKEQVMDKVKMPKPIICNGEVELDFDILLAFIMQINDNTVYLMQDIEKGKYDSQLFSSEETKILANAILPHGDGYKRAHSKVGDKALITRIPIHQLVPGSMVAAAYYEAIVNCGSPHALEYIQSKQAIADILALALGSNTIEDSLMGILLDPKFQPGSDGLTKMSVAIVNQTRLIFSPNKLYVYKNGDNFKVVLDNESMQSLKTKVASKKGHENSISPGCPAAHVQAPSDLDDPNSKQLAILYSFIQWLVKTLETEYLPHYKQNNENLLQRI